MRILLFGASGQLGTDFKSSLDDKNLVVIEKPFLDLFRENILEEKILAIRPDVIINCAAYTNVDKAEKEKKICLDLNSNAVEVIAKCSAKINALLIHFSTDYVFDGLLIGTYDEDHPHNPVNYYGLSKSRGEEAIKRLHDKYLIFRISWLYGNNGNNFVKKIINLIDSKKELNIVDDQIGAPTYTSDIAYAVTKILKNLRNSDSNNYIGTYNLSSSDKVSWYEFALKIKKLHYKNMEVNINPVNSDALTFAAKRPKNSTLNPSKLSNKFNIIMPSCDDALERYFLQK
jgi:dTDP-4-dehydrorhamnose reductase